MKQVVFLAAVGLLGWCHDAAIAQPDRPAQRSAFSNGWLSDYGKAKAEAQQTGKPLMVVLRCVP